MATVPTITIGSSAAETFSGTPGWDLIFGGGGNDIYRWSAVTNLDVDMLADFVAPADSFPQNAGVDTIDCALAPTGVAFSFALAQAGLVAGAISNSWVAGALPGRQAAMFLGQENFVGSAFADAFFVLNVATAPGLSFDGRAGSDWLAVDPGAGNPFLSAGIQVDLAAGTLRGGAGDFALVSIENVDASRFADVLAGNAVANKLRGLAGNDRIDGLAGNDTLDGGAGNDVLNGGAGGDLMIGGLGNDTYMVDTAADGTSETSTLVTEIDTVQSSVHRALGANLENLVLAGAENINGVGNALANEITGNGGRNNLNGGAGDDTLAGGHGNDTYVVDSVGDVVTETSTLATEIDMVQSSASRTLGANVENLVLTGSAAIDGVGNALANRLTGNAGSNSLDGGLGGDVLVAGAGDDVLIGGLGRDTLTGGLGADTFDFNLAVESGVITTTRDIVTDFKTAEGDRIDLSTIDADTAVDGDQAFSAPTVAGTFSGAFANPGELYFDQGAHLLYGNTDADAAADFVIQLNAVTTLSGADFIL